MGSCNFFNHARLMTGIAAGFTRIARNDAGRLHVASLKVFSTSKF